MSSHHIVRDEQEPALVIHRYLDFSFEKLGSLLEWSPTVICCGPALQAVSELGIKIDIIILAFETQSQYQDLVDAQMPVKVLTLSQPDYLSSGLQLLQKDGHHAVNVVTTEFLTAEVVDLCLPYSNSMHLGIWNEVEKAMVINQENISKWYPVGTKLSAFAPDGQTEILIADQSDQKPASFRAIDMWEVEKEGLVVVKSDRQPFILVEHF